MQAVCAEDAPSAGGVPSQGHQDQHALPAERTEVCMAQRNTSIAGTEQNNVRLLG